MRLRFFKERTPPDTADLSPRAFKTAIHLEQHTGVSILPSYICWMFVRPSPPLCCLL